MLRAQSQRKFLHQTNPNYISSLNNPINNQNQRQIRPQIKKLTVKSKQLYPQFNIQHLQLSRLNVLKGYQQMTQQLAQFNQQLLQWKLGNHQIRNLVVTYHLYTNLYSRLRFVSAFSTKQEEAISSINETIKWFAIQKPEKRNYVPQIKAQMKSRTKNIQEEIQLNQLIQANTLKHEMRAFEAMSRTSHGGIFPPKQRLKQYRRKQLAPFSTDNGEKQDKYHPMSAAKTTATSSFKKFARASYRDSLASRGSFKETKDSFKISEKKDSFPNQKQKDVQPKELNQNLNPQALEQIIQDQNRQKIVNQEEIAQDSIAPKNFQQDQPDQQGQNLLEQSQEENQGPKQLRVKKYARDPDPEQDLIAQQKIKQAQQSTIRRIINYKQQKIRIKLEQLDMKRNMNNWAKIKSSKKHQQRMKLQAMLHVSKFKKMQHRVIDSYQKVQNKPLTATLIDVGEHKMLYRSKSSHPGSIQSQMQKIKIKNTIQKYGRYIQHGNYGKKILQQQDQQILQKYRGSSLTSHTQKIIKNKYFGDILNQNNAQAFNEQNQYKIIDIKNVLSKKHISVKNNNLYKSLAIPIKSQINIGGDMFTNGKNLLSNPFFPKHLYQSKKKKKK